MGNGSFAYSRLILSLKGNHPDQVVSILKIVELLIVVLSPFDNTPVPLSCQSTDGKHCGPILSIMNGN